MKYLLKSTISAIAICCIATEMNAMNNGSTNNIDGTVPHDRPEQRQTNSANLPGSTWQNFHQTVNRLHTGQMSRDELQRLQQPRTPNEFMKNITSRRKLFAQSSSDDDDSNSTDLSTRNMQQNTTTPQLRVQNGLTREDVEAWMNQVKPLNSSDDDSDYDNNQW